MKPEDLTKYRDEEQQLQRTVTRDKLLVFLLGGIGLAVIILVVVWVLFFLPVYQ